MVTLAASNHSLEVEEMTGLDEFSQYYADFLDGSYDCVDRIVLNAYFQLGQTPGGLRVWWRQLYGSDDKLDTEHLMRLAGRLSRRVRAYAQAHHIPVIDCHKDERKHELAEQYLPRDPDFQGVFVILVGRAPAPVWEVKQSKAGKIIEIKRKQPYPYVNHYSFHLMDPDWGHIPVKLCPHPPFNAQIILNGHEYVAGQAQKAGIEFSKEGNCFTHISDPVALAQIADTLRGNDVVGQLNQVCERWIYSACLCFALSLDEQERTNFHYRYSTYQLEYSRNFLFHRGGQMEQLFNGLIDRVRAKLDVHTLKTIFGAKRRPFRPKDHQAPRLEVVVEKPTYNLTVFKLHFGKLTVKLYTKGERLLRIEVIIHNTKALPYGRSLPKFPEIAHHLNEILERFLNILHCLDHAFISDDTLDNLHTSAQVGKTRVGGIDLNQSRLRAVIEAVIALAVAPTGFAVSDLASKVREIMNVDPQQYTARQAAYDLKKLRGKNFVRKLGRSRRYGVIPEGLRTLTALWVLREKVIKPVLAGAAKPKRGPKPRHQSPIDVLYQAIQLAMFNLFQALGIAV
jgi:hypothetical protein